MKTSIQSFRLRLALLVLAAMFVGVGELQAQSKSFQNEDISGRDLANQNLDGADFTGATLTRVTFSRARLKGAIFKDADLRGAAFYKADVSGADFTGAELSANGMDEANFSRAILEGVDLKGNITGFRVNFRGANLKRTKGWNICSACDFGDADLRGANLLRLMPHPETRFRGALYNDSTRFPTWFDPVQLGLRKAD